MAPTLLSALSTRGDPPTIKVKVLRIWDSVNLSTNEVISVDMILTDKKVWLLSICDFHVSTIPTDILLKKGKDPKKTLWIPYIQI
jgi:hypothetical protein